MSGMQMLKDLKELLMKMESSISKSMFQRTIQTKLQPSLHWPQYRMDFSMELNIIQICWEQMNGVPDIQSPLF